MTLILDERPELGAFGSFDPGPLAAGDVLDISCTSDERAGTFTRAVGAVVDEQPPSFIDVTHEANAAGTPRRATVTATVDDDLSPAVAMRVDGELVRSEVVRLQAVRGQEVTFPVTFEARANGGDACFSLVAIDWAGNEGLHLDELCVFVPGGVGSTSCASAPAPAVATLVVLLAMLRGRRR
jgi:hypothetical protein